MTYILRRVIVEDVEAEKRAYAATAAERRGRGVGRETYFVDPDHPGTLVIAFDGHDFEALHAAIHPQADGGVDVAAEVPANVARDDVVVVAAEPPANAAREGDQSVTPWELKRSIDALAAILDQLRGQLRAVEAASMVPEAMP